MISNILPIKPSIFTCLSVLQYFILFRTQGYPYPARAGLLPAPLAPVPAGRREDCRARSAPPYRAGADEGHGRAVRRRGGRVVL